MEASRRQIDLSDWRPCRLSRDQVERADLIVLMDYENFRALRRDFPEALERTVMLGLFRGRWQLEIPDPYGRSRLTYSRVAGTIENSIDALAAWFVAHHRRTGFIPVCSRAGAER